MTIEIQEGEMSLKERLRLEEMETTTLLGGPKLPFKGLVDEEEVINDAVVCEEENTTKQ